MSGTLVTKRNPVARALFDFTQGIEVDQRLAAQEVAVQKAWAKGLAWIGTLSREECETACRTLDEALVEIEKGRFEWRVEDEDVHMNLERYLTERHGGLGKKIHLGRSRNDLIATTLRLFVRDSIVQTQTGVKSLALALAGRAEAFVDVIVPGMTHLQHGQPVRFGHVLAGHAQALLRDLKRLESCAQNAMTEMPLGSAALSGTPLSIDLKAIAGELGFAAPPANSYDAVGDRDFMVETIDAYALIGLHLSRLSEDFIIWSSSAMGLVKLPPAWSTGSSIMPNKRNPDVPELIRAKSAHLTGAAANAHTLVKAVPTSYGSDLHELKTVYMRALDELTECLSVFPSFVEGIQIDTQRARELLSRGHLLATEVADHLSSQGVPFREAYSKVAAMVEEAEAKGVQIEEIARLNGITGLSHEAAVERRTNEGGTARAQVLRGISVLRSRLG